MAATSRFDPARLQQLTARLLSSAVQVPETANHEDIPAKFDDDEVKKVFLDHVPGVAEFLFRGKPGQPSLNFIAGVYRDGLHAFAGTPVDTHLRSLLRYVVHRGAEVGKQVASDLVEVAEGFMDCQAVQARTIEKVGLRMTGSRPNFKGLVVRLLGEYKSFAIRVLAQDRLDQGLARDYDAVHTHYENRLTADLGRLLGLDADAVKLARLDGHADRRFERLVGEEAEEAAERCRELFDVKELLHAFVAEANNFGEASLPDSLARLFLSWADESMRDKFVVLDVETASRTDIDMQLALCIFETLFLGAPASPKGERYRGKKVQDLFGKSEGADASSNTAANAIHGRQAGDAKKAKSAKQGREANLARGAQPKQAVVESQPKEESDEASSSNAEEDLTLERASARKRASERRRKLKEARQRRQKNARSRR